MEQFPDVLPDTSTMFKKWVWKDGSNMLEQISTGLQANKDKHIMSFIKPKTTPGKSKVIQSQSHLNPSKAKKNVSSPIVKNNSVFSPKPSVKMLSSAKRLIALEDIKGVALDSLIEIGEVSQSFQDNLKNNHIDGLLCSLLSYFDLYFGKTMLENKPKDFSAGQSLSDQKAYDHIVKRIEVSQKKLSEEYCCLVLGLNEESQHHLCRGKQRKSQTIKDRFFYENLYSFCCQVIWITFRRTDIDLIQKELGRLFRSDTFSPHGRQQNTNDFRLASELKNEEMSSIKLAPSSARTNRRPAIQSIINQRSPVLVALLPNSKDASAWLLDRRKAIPLVNSSKPEEQKEDCVENENGNEINNVGIIGEQMAGFNPFTLAPFGEDDEEENEESEQDERRPSLMNGGETSNEPLIGEA